jgi:hypothetical protein
MSDATLSGVHAKINRAEKHLAEFDAQVQPILAACREGIVWERDELQFHHVFRIARVPTLTSDISAAIGDAIHNIRVSLDYLAWQLVKATGGIPCARTGGTAFPVLKVRPVQNGRNGDLPQIPPGVPDEVRSILDEVQPYKRVKPAFHELAILNGLDNHDKHHELLMAVIGNEAAGGFLGGAELVHFHSGPYNDGDELARFTYPTLNSENKLGVTFLFAVRFNEPAAGAWGKTLGASKVVRNSLRYVEDVVIPRFQSFF